MTAEEFKAEVTRVAYRSGLPEAAIRRALDDVAAEFTPISDDDTD